MEWVTVAADGRKHYRKGMGGRRLGMNGRMPGMKWDGMRP